jgi:hypothetical protein
MGKLKERLEDIAEVLKDPDFWCAGTLLLATAGASIGIGIASYHEFTKIAPSIPDMIAAGVGTFGFAGISVPLAKLEYNIVRDYLP